MSLKFKQLIGINGENMPEKLLHRSCFICWEYPSMSSQGNPCLLQYYWVLNKTNEQTNKNKPKSLILFIGSVGLCWFPVCCDKTLNVIIISHAILSVAIK